jgi:hypothetical protein
LVYSSKLKTALVFSLFFNIRVMKRLICSFVFLLYVIHGIAQNTTQPLVQLGVLSVFDRENKNLLSARVNPAVAIASNRINYLLYGERRYLLDDLPFIMAAVYVPIHQWKFTFDFSRLGGNKFQQSEANLSLSKSLHPKIDFGLTFSGLSLHTNMEKWRPNFGYKIGVVFGSSENLRMGIAISERRKTNNFIDNNPLIEMSAGFGYTFSNITTSTFHISRSTKGSLDMVSGIVMKVKNKLRIDAGYSSKSGSLFGGVCFAYKSINLGCYLSNHPYLGTTPALMLKSL